MLMQHACCVYGTHCLYLEKKTKSVYLRLHFEPQIARVPPWKAPFSRCFWNFGVFKKATSPFKSQPTIKHTFSRITQT